MNMVITADIYEKSVTTCIQEFNKKRKLKVSSRVYRIIGTGSDQYSRKKTCTKTILTGKVKDRRKSKIAMSLKIGHKMLMFHKASSYLCTFPRKPTPIIKFLVFIRAREAI